MSGVVFRQILPVLTLHACVRALPHMSQPHHFAAMPKLQAFNVPWTLPNLLSIAVGAAAAVLFAIAKSKQ